MSIHHQIHYVKALTNQINNKFTPFKLQPPLLSVSNKLEQKLHPRHFLKETVFEVRKGNLFMIHARNQILLENL